MIIACQPFVLYITFSTFVMQKSSLMFYCLTMPQIQFTFVSTALKRRLLPRLSIVKHLISSVPLQGVRP